MDALEYATNPPTLLDVSKAPTLQDYWAVRAATSLPKVSKSKQTAYKIAKKKVERIMLLPVDKLNIKVLQDAVDAKAPTYYPAKDIKTVLTQLYKRAVAENWGSANLAEFIELPALEEEELRPFSELELRKFWDAYGKGDDFVGYILLMIYTGMMPGELMLLKKDMIAWTAYETRGWGLKTKKRKKTPIIFPELLHRCFWICASGQRAVSEISYTCHGTSFIRNTTRRLPAAKSGT